jgi:hypothetical protein
VGRDPIEEKGGKNLYGFCGNNGVNRWDYLGMIYPDDDDESGIPIGTQTTFPNGQIMEYVGNGAWVVVDGSTPFINFAIDPRIYQGIPLQPFFVRPTNLTPPSIGGLTIGQISSDILSGAGTGALNFAIGLGQAGIGTINTAIDLITDPVGTITSGANTVGTLAGTAVYNPGAITSAIGSTVNAALNTPQGAAAASQGIGNLTGMILIGMALSPSSSSSMTRWYTSDFVGPIPNGAVQGLGNGHLASLHVAQTPAQLAARAAAEGLPRVSSFASAAEAEAAVATVFRANASAIDTWVANGAVGKLPFNAPFSGGSVFQSSTGTITQGTGARIILRGNGSGGFNIVTGFPTP